MSVELEITEYLEITVKIGCSLRCLKYCPQEITINKYSDEQKTMTLNSFKTILGHIPPKFPVVFAGFCEPFLNKETINFIRYAHETQHPIGIFTTLEKVLREDLMELLRYDYFVFCLHLPDGHNTNISITEEYKDNLLSALTNIPNISFSIMNDEFITDNRENVARGLYDSKHNWFVHCSKWDKSQFVVLPNGDIYLCCMDFGLQHKLGNLIVEDYNHIKQRYHPGYQLCKKCSYALPIPRFIGRRIVRQLTQH